MKILVAALILNLTVTCAMAQEGFRMGLKGGPQSSWMFNGDDSDNPDWEYVSTIRPVFGGSFGYNFTPSVGVQIDALYSMQGQRYTLNGLEGNRELNYLKVPVLFNFNTASDGVGFFYLNAGPQFGFLLSYSVEQGGTILPLSLLVSSDAYESLNIGAVFALGAGFNLTDFLQLTVGMRLDFAFTDAENKDNLIYLLAPDRPATYNATGALEFGFRYVLTKGD